MNKLTELTKLNKLTKLELQKKVSSMDNPIGYNLKKRLTNKESYGINLLALTGIATFMNKIDNIIFIPLIIATTSYIAFDVYKKIDAIKTTNNFLNEEFKLYPYDKTLDIKKEVLMLSNELRNNISYFQNSIYDLDKLQFYIHDSLSLFDENYITNKDDLNSHLLNELKDEILHKLKHLNGELTPELKETFKQLSELITHTVELRLLEKKQTINSLINEDRLRTQSFIDLAY